MSYGEFDGVNASEQKKITKVRKKEKKKKKTREKRKGEGSKEGGKERKFPIG